MPLTSRGSQISVSLDYVMEPKSFAEGGGQGFCVYLLDPSVEGWDQKFDGTGPLGFVGKTGAIVGVGVDCAGLFCEGDPASIAIKRASDSELLCKPVAVEGGVVTRKDEFWRKLYITFDIEANTCDVMIGGKKVLDEISFTGVQIPKTVCVAVCAGTAEGRSNRICVNKLKLKDMDQVKERANELATMSPADRAASLAAMSPEDQAAALAAMSPEDQAAALALLSPEAEAAALTAISEDADAYAKWSQGRAGVDKVFDVDDVAESCEVTHPAMNMEDAESALMQALISGDEGAIELAEKVLKLASKAAKAQEAMSPEDRAAALAAMSPEDQAAALVAMSPEDRAAALAAMSPEDQAAALAAIPAEEQAAALAAMSSEICSVPKRYTDYGE